MKLMIYTLLPLTSIIILIISSITIFYRKESDNIKILTIRVALLFICVTAFVNIFFAQNNQELVFDVTFFVAVLYLSFVFMHNIQKELKQKKEFLKLTKDLERANTELKRLDSAKSEFISIASHQLRTPLTAIKGYISLILEGAYGKVASETETALNKIFLANERLIQLVEDLLNITHIEAGRLEYHVGDVHLEKILEELYDMFTLRAKDKNLDFVLELSDGKLPVIQADESKLREVISNLIDNAIKYTNKGFVHVSVEYDKHVMRIIVEDSGMGISSKSMKTLFTKFSRGTDSSKVYTEGTGLGLFVGKNLIESQGGHIYAQSDGVGKGSKFIIEIPIKNIPEL